MKKQFIDQLFEKTQVRDVFLAYDLQKRTTREGKPYLTMRLRDKTGSMPAILWAFDEKTHNNLPREGFVEVKGVVGEYNSALQLRLLAISAYKGGDLDVSAFLQESTKDQEVLSKSLAWIVEGINDEYLKKLLDTIFADNEFSRNFTTAPAAVSIHHAYLGGLLEHTLNVTKIAKSLADIYDDINRDLLITGAIIHDIGKIVEYKFKTTIAYATEGRLKGHHVLGCEMIRDFAKRIDGFPESLLMRLEHMILSHHGTREWGSPVLPMFTEAALLHFADNIDARYNVFANSQPDPTDETWSGYNRELGHYIYLGGDD